MFDPKQLLETFLGREQHPAGQQSTNRSWAGAADLLGGIDRQKAGSFAMGAATSGLIGLLLGSKKARKFGGGLLGYGGAAVLGGLAYKAWQNYQMNQGRLAISAGPGFPGPAVARPSPTASGFDPSQGTATDGRPFALALIRAMIAAVKADGHIDAREQSLLQARIEAMALDAEAKAFIFDELARPTDLDAIAALPRDLAQAAEIWLFSRLACDPNDAREKAYLTALATKLKLPTDLVAQLEGEVSMTAPPIAVDWAVSCRPRLAGRAKPQRSQVSAFPQADI